MQSKVKLSKRQIKEDKFTTFMLTSKQQMTENWQFFVIGGVVVLLAIVGIAYFISNSSSAKDEAGELFARGMTEYRSGNRQVSVTTFQQILDDHGGNQVAQKSTFMLGQVNFELRNFSEAQRYWNMYLDKYGDNKLDRAASLAGIAASFEEQSDFTQGAAKFLEAIAEFPEGPMTGYYHAGAMRNYLALNQPDKAREQLDLIKEKYPDTDMYMRAARYFGEQTAAGPQG